MISGHEFEQTLGDIEGQGRPVMLPLMGVQKVRQDLAAELIFLTFVTLLLQKRG